MAVAGFTQEELELSFQENLLTVKGQTGRHRAQLPLPRHSRTRFRASLPAGRLCAGEGADLKNGLLHIDLVREVPEAMKPRKIEING